MKTESTSVLVVGGGLVGLSAAVFLAWRGVKVVLVERHPGSSAHPRAIGYRQRSMELFRAVGLGDRIPQGAPGTRLRRIRVESLAGTWFEEAPWAPADRPQSTVEYSPHTGAAIAQDRLEPLLRERALELGADVRLETELLSFEQDADGVTARVRARDGSESAIRAAYLIGADGHRSPVREALGIARDGRGFMRTARSVLFRAPLDEYLRSGFSQFSIDQPGFEAFLTTYRDGRWVLFFRDDVERDEATLRAFIEKAIGRSDLPIEILTTGRWELSALIADRFSSGRVFLAGDAAHTLPPSRGGFGANTGIEDVHNLAWKIAAVLSGESMPSLLDTYDAERRPIAWLRHQQIFAHTDFEALAGAEPRDMTIYDDAAMELGQLYRSSAVLGAGAELPPARLPDEWKGQPGTRAPHRRMPGSDERQSTLDLLQRGWVLFTADDGWQRGAANVSEQLGIAIRSVSVVVDPSDLDGYLSSLGLAAGGASLVRPDGYIAWRSVERPSDPARALAEAVARVASARRKATA